MKSDSGEWFSHEVVHGYVRIRELHYRDFANLWFIRRDASSFVLIDCGTGAVNLYDYLTRKGLLPVGGNLLVILTHQHNDHAGGARHFQGLPNVEICAHADDLHNIESGVDEVRWGNKKTLWGCAPFSGFDATTFQVMVPVKVDRVLHHGDHIGGFEVIHLPGHSPGCIALLDAKMRHVFTGDLVYEYGLTIDTFPSSNAKDCLQSMIKLKSLKDKYDLAFPGHWSVMTSDAVNGKCDDYIRTKQDDE